MRHSRRFCAAKLKVSLFWMYNIMTTCLYFDILKFDVFDEVFLSAALSRLH